MHILDGCKVQVCQVYMFTSPGCDIDDAVLKANGIVQKDVSTPTVQKETEDYHYMTIILWKMRDTTKGKQYKGNR
jgi:hypothetical protein